MSSPLIVSTARTPSLNIELDCPSVSGGAIAVGRLCAAGGQGMALVVERLS